MPKLRRAQKPSADRILAAAEQLFASEGYSEVSLRQLIAASGVSTTAFYARFPSKAAVLETLTAKFFAELHARAGNELRAVRDRKQGVARGVELLVDHLQPRKALVRLILAEAGTLAPIMEQRRRSYDLLAALLARYVKPHAAWVIIGALELQLVRWAVWGDITSEQLPDALYKTALAAMPKE